MCQMRQDGWFSKIRSHLLKHHALSSNTLTKLSYFKPKLLCRLHNSILSRRYLILSFSSGLLSTIFLSSKARHWRAPGNFHKGLLLLKNFSIVRSWLLLLQRFSYRVKVIETLIKQSLYLLHTTYSNIAVISRPPLL